MRSKFFAICALLVALGILSACGSDTKSTVLPIEPPVTDRLSGPVPTKSTYLTAQGMPGDLWEWTIDRSVTPFTFSATNVTASPNLTYSGTAETMANGFLRMTVTASNDSTITLPKTVYTMESPGTVMLVQAASGTGHVGVGLAEATENPCPVSGNKYNWIDMSSDANPAYGISTAAVSGSSYGFNHLFFLSDGSPADPASGSHTGFNCSAGKLTRGDDPAVIQITDTKMFIVDFGPERGAIAGSIQEAVDQNDFLNSGREFRGIIDASEGSEPVWARVASGKLDGGSYIDFANNVENPTQVELTFNAADSSQPGVLRGTTNDLSEGRSYPFVMIVRKITAFGSSKYVALGTLDKGAGQSQSFLVLEK